MAARAVPERFLVAFSLAGEQRELVRALAEEVEKILGPSTVFFDEWYEHYIAGNDADITLQRIYHEQCELAVVCVSSQYGSKPWTRAEHTAIRSRYMQAANSEEDRRRILAVRVGDGDVDGIFFTAVVPDIRARSAAEAAQLVIDRLNLVRPAASTPQSSAYDWPVQAPTLFWPMADHTEARGAFGGLLTRSSQCRLLSIRGPSETGKSHMSKQMLANGLLLPELVCGRFDFKGTTNMDFELDAFVQSLQVAPPQGQRLNERFGRIFDELKRLARPTLLIFDTYEAAGEATEWVERVLLQDLMRSSWLRVVVVGQAVPTRNGATWESIASGTIILQSPGPEDWFEYGRQHRPDDKKVTLDFVTQVHQMAEGKAALLAGLLGPG